MLQDGERDKERKKDKLTPKPHFSRRRPNREMVGADTLEPGNVFPMLPSIKRRKERKCAERFNYKSDSILVRSQDVASHQPSRCRVFTTAPRGQKCQAASPRGGNGQQKLEELEDCVGKLTSSSCIMEKWLPGMCRKDIFSMSRYSSHRLGPKSDRLSSRKRAWPLG